MRLENTEKMTQCQLARYQLKGRIFGREDIYLYLYGPRAFLSVLRLFWAIQKFRSAPRAVALLSATDFNSGEEIMML